MNEKDYTLLLELHKLKNITKVSKKLFLSQPALTKRLKKIEEELGCELLIRSKKGVIFTPIGESIIPYVEFIANTTAQMHNYISANQGFIGGTLSIGSSLNFARYVMPEVLKNYTERYPLVDVKIRTAQSKEILQMIQNDEISVATVRGEFKWDEGRTLLSTEPMCFVCSIENASKPLDSYPYIGRHTDPDQTSRIHDWLEQNGLSELNTKLWIDDIDSCKEMVKHGLGWCILPKVCLSDFDGYTENLYFENSVPFLRNTYALYKHSYYQLPQVQLFIECLKRRTERNL